MTCLTFQRRWAYAQFVKSFNFPVPNQDIIIDAFGKLWNTSNKPEEEKGAEVFLQLEQSYLNGDLDVSVQEWSYALDILINQGYAIDLRFTPELSYTLPEYGIYCKPIDCNKVEVVQDNSEAGFGVAYALPYSRHLDIFDDSGKCMELKVHYDYPEGEYLKPCTVPLKVREDYLEVAFDQLEGGYCKAMFNKRVPDDERDELIKTLPEGEFIMSYGTCGAKTAVIQEGKIISQHSWGYMSKQNPSKYYNFRGDSGMWVKGK